MCAEWREGPCLWRALSWSPLSLQELCLVSSHVGRGWEADRAGYHTQRRLAAAMAGRRGNTAYCTCMSPGGPCPHSYLSLSCWRSILYPLLLALAVTPPVRIESSSSHVSEGQSLDLNCLVSGQTHPQISWHKRGGSLPARHQVGDGKQRKNPKGPRSRRGKRHRL